MSRMKSLAAMMAIAGMSGQSFMASGRGDEVDTLIPKELPVPKGCKEYWFNEIGCFSTERMRHDEVVFKCHALNDKSAIKKFNRYKSTQTP